MLQQVANTLGIEPVMELRWFIFLATAVVTAWVITSLTWYANAKTSAIKITKWDIAIMVAFTALLAVGLTLLYEYGVEHNLHSSIHDDLLHNIESQYDSRTPLVDTIINPKDIVNEAK